MNWMFPKAIGAILVALSALCVTPTGLQDTPDPPTPAPLPASKSKAKAATAKVHVRDPGPVATAPAPPMVASDSLSPLAKAVITTWNGEDVPKVWPCGVPIGLTADRSVVGDHPQSLKWVIQPAWVDQWSSRTPDGRQLSVATGTKSKTIRVTLYVAKNDTFDMVTVTVAVRPDPNEPGDRDGPEPEPKPGPEPPGPAPPPGPTPPPTPAPVPVLTPIGTQVYNLAIRDIPDIPSRKDKVLALAKSHETVANQITQAVAGVPAYAHLLDPQAIIDTTVKYNRIAVGTDRAAFVPFFTALNNEVLKPLVPTTLSTASGHIDVWKDIAAGLRGGGTSTLTRSPTMARKRSPKADEPFKPQEKLFGRIDDLEMVAKEVDHVLGFLRRPIFYSAAYPIIGTGAGKTVLLYKFLPQYFGGKFPIHAQTIGDCVSHGWGLSIDTLKATQIAAGAKETFTGETATEIIYAGSRVEVGSGKCGVKDGSIGAWAAQFVTMYGTMVRDKYDTLDLTDYSGETAKKLGMPNAGVPDDMEPFCREHPIQTTSLVRTYEEARDALANGYPIPVSSSIGFEGKGGGQTVRDKDGFAKRSGEWMHCMCFLAVDDAYHRPGLLCVNSWDEHWVTGPTRHEQPEGSFWVDAETADAMLHQGDSFAISGYAGYPAQDLEYMLI